jgi:hypothetical protein
MTPGQRIAVFCNPVSHALDLAILGLTMYGGGGTQKVFPGYHCVNAIKDRVQQAESGEPEPVKATRQPGEATEEAPVPKQETEEGANRD